MSAGRRPFSDIGMDTVRLAVHPLASDLGQALAGAVFPLTREQLTRIARENGASPTMLSLLESLPPRLYRSVSEVEAAELAPPSASPSAPPPPWEGER